MKFIKYWSLAIMIIICSVVSFILGRNYNAENFSDTKDYEAACLQADFIRYLIDHFCGKTECADIGSEIEECYYEWFGELDNGNFGTKHITHVKDFEQYYWCY